jgi:hypothetical protein
LGSVSRRLERLEERARSSREEAKERTRSAESREVLRRLSDSELGAYVGALRCLNAESAPLDEDRTILDWITQLYEEMRQKEYGETRPDERGDRADNPGFA